MVVFADATAVKWLHIAGETIRIQKATDGLWYDKWLCVYGLTGDDEFSVKDPRAGAFGFELPEGHPLNAYCAGHDYMYECPAFQAFNTRSEADQMLEDTLETGEYSWLAKPFKWLSKLFGGRLWENKETR